jgi:RNA polymerase sigma-70 factor (ECF subfamily)
MTPTLYHLSAELIEAEEEVVKAAQQDPRNFERLYKKYYSRVVNFIYHRTADKELSFEIASQTFYKALDNLPGYKNKGLPFSAWLFRIALNETNSWFRKQNRIPVLNIDSVGLHELNQNIEETFSPGHDEQLAQALQQLDDEELELVNMRFFEKRSFAEIGGILNRGESACKMKLYRTLEKLKKILTSE